MTTVTSKKNTFTEGEEIMAENPSETIFTSEKLYKIINDPAADNSVKCHQGNVAKQTEPTENPPFLSWLFQLTVHERGLV